MDENDAAVADSLLHPDSTSRRNRSYFAEYERPIELLVALVCGILIGAHFFAGATSASQNFATFGVAIRSDSSSKPLASDSQTLSASSPPFPTISPTSAASLSASMSASMSASISASLPPPPLSRAEVEESCPNFDDWRALIHDRIKHWDKITVNMISNTFKTFESGFGSGIAQVLADGSVHAVNREVYVWRAGSVLWHIGEAMKKYNSLARKYAPVEFMYYLDDHPLAEPVSPKFAPVFSFTMRDEHTISIASPDHSLVFYESQRADENAAFGMWDDWFNKLIEYDKIWPYESRIKRMLFRGAPNFDRDHFMEYLETHIPNFTGVTDIIDFDIVYNWEKSSYSLPRVPSANYSQYAVHLYLHGHGASMRLKYQLMSGSPVVYYRSEGYDEFFLPFLKPGEHYMVATTYESILDIGRYLLDNPVKAKAMADKTMEVMLRYMTFDSTLCYWLAAIAEYKPLMDYEVRKHHDDITVYDAATGAKPDFRELNGKAWVFGRDVYSSWYKEKFTDLMSGWNR